MSFLKIKLRVLICALVALVLLAAPPASAENEYDCGTYGAGSYNQNCPEESESSSSSSSSSSSTSSSSSSETAEEDSTEVDKIVLNEYDSFDEESGKTLELETEQVVYFNLVENGSLIEHKITIKEIGFNYVVVTIESTPEDVRILLLQTVEHDANDDGKNDIAITLNSIAGDVVNMTFRLLGENVGVNSETDSEEDDAAGSRDGPSMLTKVAMYGFGVAAGLGILWFLISRRPKNNQAGPY